ncbi:MAG: hypothetical protein ABL986_15925 [Vicinamibacterales bacterium]
MSPLVFVVTKCRQIAVALAMLAVSPLLASGATRGPDAGGYTATDATLYSFEDLAGAAGAVGILADTDEGSAALTLPFSFVFYGQSYTQVCVSSNGALYFITDATQCGAIIDFANGDLSSVSTPGDLPAVLPFWTDLTFLEAGAGSVLYQTIGVLGSRKFVVQWNNAHTGDPSKPVTVQLALLEGTNRILFQYRNVDLGAGNAATLGGAATIGIRNTGGVASGEQIQWSFNAKVLANESALLFAPPGILTPTLTWATPASIVYGTALGAAQLNAVANAPGILTYTPAAGTVLPAGASQLSVTFTPSDPNSYAPASASVNIAVTQASSTTTITCPVSVPATGSPLTPCSAIATGAGNLSVPVVPTYTNNVNAGTANVSATFGGDTNHTGSSATSSFLITGSSTPLAATVVSPNGLEQRFIGVPTTIRWTATGATSITVALSRNGGQSYTDIAGCTNLPGTTTECAWTPTGPATLFARMRVTAKNAGATTAVDESNVTFLLSSGTPSVTVQNPNTAVAWAIGTTREIIWTHNLGGGARFAIDLTRNNGASWETLAPSVPGILLVGGTYSWQVTGPVTANARVRVRSLDSPATDTGNSLFAIAAPAVTVTAPNTNVSWSKGSQRTITWTHNLGAGTSMKVELSRDGGTTWAVLAASVANTSATTGSYKWTVTGPNTTMARIRVTWTADATVQDVSNVNFRIQ